MKKVFFCGLLLLLATLVFGMDGEIPQGLPNNFGFGAIDKADNYASYGPHWYKQADGGWDYSYNYLTNGWEDWIANGGWAKQEINAWEARNQIQVFTYYRTNNSISNYTSTSWMTDYFNNFKLLMEVIRDTATKKVIVHIEPDLLGFWQSPTVQGGYHAPDQDGVVMVGSSGFDETCDRLNINELPNTIQSWSRALHAIRNQYSGGKVILAHHYSHWAGGRDVFVEELSQTIQDQEVDEVIDYIKAVEGDRPYDLLFSDPANRDADYFRIRGFSSYQDNSRWTDPDHTNTSGKRSWGKIGYIINRISDGLDRRIMFWQVPVGNTYYKTCNNSAGHFRDNSAQEFLPSSSNYGQSGTPGDDYSPATATGTISGREGGPKWWSERGVIAVLFGSGLYESSDLTQLRDYPNDGITNPTSDTVYTGVDAPLAFNQWGQATSTYADNEGGYIRLGVKAYSTAGKITIRLTDPVINPNGRETDDGRPIVHWQDPFTIITPGCADGGGSARYEVVQGATIVQSGTMAPDGNGNFTAIVPALYPAHGDAQIKFYLTCGGVEQPAEIVDIYIDPSGTVKTTTGEPISKATVTLFRSDSPSGPFTIVPDGSTIMSPTNRTNPDLTGQQGDFGWDVIAGYYIVRAEKAGYHAPGNPSRLYVETGVLTIPPPITNLDLRLEKDQINNGLTVRVDIMDDWGSGYRANLVVTNTTANPVEWNVQFDVTGTIYDFWNAVYSQAGSKVTARGTGWNKIILPGQSLHDVGFCAKRDSNGNNGLTVRVDIMDDWGSGYRANLVVTNTTANPVEWNVQFDVTGTIYDFWNAVYSQAGSKVTARGAGWNKIIQPGQSLRDVGFCARRY